MASSSTHFFLSSLVFLMISFFQLSSHQQLCHKDEYLALMQFKDSFVIERQASTRPKVGLWKSQGVDCDSWEGISCDQNTSHVIGLDLSSSCLFGSINSSSSLFRLGHLQYLNLALNDFNSSKIPSTMGNLSRLTYLNLSGSFFSGQIPHEISKLSNLAKLDLSFNLDHSHQGLLELKRSDLKNIAQNLTKLEWLDLSYVGINSPIPKALANLSSLTHLHFGQCGLHGKFPIDIFQLPKLQVLDLENNWELSGSFPEFHSHSQLRALDVGNTTFSGELPISIGTLSSLEYLDDSSCNLSGWVPPSIGNLTKLHGSLPSSISKLKNLETLFVYFNNLSGIVKFDTFLELKSLKYLELGFNNFSLVIKTPTNGTIPKFKILGLSFCNLREFPYFLRNQSELNVLSLGSNNIHGQIPSWILNLSASLWVLELSDNKFTSFEESFLVFPSSIFYLDLSSNFLKGSLPIPPLSILFYLVSGNMFSGEIPTQFCNLTSLQVLDLSHNNLSGTNNLHGRLPRSLGNCKTLEFLDLGKNKIKDIFPSWLGALPELRVLILHSNRFYGTISIKVPETDFLFPKLHIINLSDNGFVGTLPIDSFVRWNAMADLDGENTTYLQAYKRHLMIYLFVLPFVFPYSMTITNKGEKREYPKILEVFSAMDLSCNKFDGEIPEVVGNLKRLQLLNLSNNILVGPIPTTLGYLANLEALDLSQNKLTGRIPTQLTRLNFLEVFNVSHNHLTGPIPKGQQFDTFENSSFDGNSGLCGMPLSRKCDYYNFENLPPTSSTSEGNEDSGLLAEFDWKLVLLGYGCGFLIGVVIGNIVFTRKREWFTKTFRIW
ncbi:hypothetical protein SLE2022_006880 [Rubroshorea leprosula]